MLSAIGLAYVGVSISLDSEQEGWSWFVSTTPGFIFVIATVLAGIGLVVNAVRSRSVTSLRGQVRALQGDLKEVRGDYHNFAGSHPGQLLCFVLL